MSQLTIRNCTLDYRVARALADAEGTRQRLDLLARRELASSLERHMPEIDDGRRIVFIDQVALGLSFNNTNDDQALVRAIASGARDAVRTALEVPSTNTVVFTDRASFIASFLADLLHGRAHDVWYYFEFEDLLSASPSQAAMELLTADPDDGRDALRQLPPADLELLFSRLAHDDVAVLANRCFAPPGPSHAPREMVTQWLGAITRAIQAIQGFAHESTARRLIRLYRAILQQRPELGPDANLGRFLRDLLKASEHVSGSAMSALRVGDIATAMRGADAAMRVLMASIAPDAGRTLADVIDRLAAPSRESTSAASAIAGLALLLATWRESGIGGALASIADDLGPHAPALLRYVIAAHCAGRENFTRIANDPAVALFADGVKAPAPAAIRSLAQKFGPHHAARLSARVTVDDRDGDPSLWLAASDLALPPDDLMTPSLIPLSALAVRTFAARLGALTHSSIPYLRTNILASPGQINFDSEGVRVRLSACPLQVVLRMCGFDRGTFEVPWLKQTPLAFEFDT